MWTLVILACGARVDGPAIVTDTSTPIGPPSVTDPRDTSDTSEPSLDTVAPNFAATGPSAVAVDEGSAPLSGCDMAFTRYTPEHPETPAVVILSHGFVRARRHMAGWAHHLASWGVVVVTPDLCHASLLDTDHLQNGADLRALAAVLVPGGEVIYAGQSAGGLAAILAGASGNPGTIAVFGLDPVDAAELGANAASSLVVPVAALLGEPSACNSANNALTLLGNAPDATLLRVPGADHCSFENPTDAGCTLVCGGDGGALGPQAIEDTVAGLFTAWVLWRSGANGSAAQWWTAGEAWFERLLADGRIALAP